MVRKKASKLSAHPKRVPFLETKRDSRFVFGHNPLPMLIYELETLAILEVNRAAIVQYRYPRKEFLTLTIADLHAAEDSLRMPFAKGKKRRILKYSGEWRHRVKNGRMIDVEIISRPIDFNGLKSALVIAQNITERKKAEDALRKSEAKHRGVFENIHDLYFETDVDGKLLEISPSIEIISKGQYTRDNVLGKSILDFYFDPTTRLAFINLLREKKQVSDFELILKNRDGSVVECSVSAKLQSATSRNPEIIIGTIRDITGRKKIEEALRTSESEFRELWGATVEGIFIHNQGRVLEVNDATCQIFGYTREQVIGKTLFDFTPAESHDLIRQRLASQSEEGFEISALRADGARIILEVFAKGIPYHGNPTRMVAIRDITGRKKAEEALRESEERFSVLSEATFEGIVVSDKGRIIDANEQSAVMSGYQQAEMIGLKVEIFVAPESLDLVLQHIGSGNEEPYEHLALRKDGSTFPVEVRAKSLPYKGRVVRVTAIRDISQRKRADQERQAMYEIAGGVTTTANLDELLKLIHRSLGKVLYAENCFVALYDSNTGLFNFPYFVDKFDLTPEPATLEKSCTSYVFRTGKPHLIPQAVFDRLLEQNEVELVGSPSPSWIGVPLQTPSKTIGVLVLQHYEKENVYSEHDLHFLATVGSEVAIVIERKKAEAKLRDSEANLNVILESTADGILAVDNKGKVLRTNKLFADLWRIPHALIDSKDDNAMLNYVLSQLVDPERFLSKVRSLYASYAEDSDTLQFKDGRVFERYSAPILMGGEIVGRVWSFRDVTERKAAESLLRENRERLRAIFESATIGLAFGDLTGRFLDINPAMQRILGYTLNELNHKTMAEITHPDDFVADMNLFQELLEGKRQHYELEKRYFHKDGHMVWGLAGVSLVHDGNGKPKFAIGMLEDITERKLAEEQLQKLSLAVGQSPASIVITDTKGNIEYVNPKFTQVTGYTLEEAIGKNPRILKSGETSPEEYKRMWETILSGEPWRGEFHNKKKSGELFWEMASISPVKNRDNVITNFVAVKEDITERKRLEEHFQQAQKMESIGTLAGGIAHDFNNILSIILGHSSILERSKENPQKLSESIKAITKATERGAGIVKQLLTFARKTEALFETVSINDMIREITKLLNETFPKTITLSTALQQDLPSIVADAGQIHQVLLNLCVNARDAMPKGGTLSISSRTVEGDSISSRFPDAAARQYVQIEIADTGMGMDEATRQRVFEPFFTTKGLGKGTGLGLAVVSGIVGHHDGFIDVRSVLGGGTTFTVYLPIPERAMEEPQRAQKSIEVIAGGTETILVIEDEEMLRNLAKSTLASKGYTVLTAEDGMQGVEMYQSHQDAIAVVLSDIGLPGLSGQDVLKKIREINPKAKVIMASGFIDPDAKSEMYKSGAKNFIQKPYSPDEVLQKIREVIDGHQ